MTWTNMLDTATSEEEWEEKRKEPFEIPGTLVDTFTDQKGSEFEVYRVSSQLVTCSKTNQLDNLCRRKKQGPSRKNAGFHSAIYRSWFIH